MHGKNHGPLEPMIVHFFWSSSFTTTWLTKMFSKLDIRGQNMLIMFLPHPKTSPFPPLWCESKTIKGRELTPPLTPIPHEFNLRLTAKKNTLPSVIQPFSSCFWYKCSFLQTFKTLLRLDHIWERELLRRAEQIEVWMGAEWMDGRKNKCSQSQKRSGGLLDIERGLKWRTYTSILPIACFWVIHKLSKSISKATATIPSSHGPLILGDWE